MWKIDLFGLLFGLNDKFSGSKINIGYEKGGQHSAFSIATNLIYFNQYKQELILQIAPRYYYNLKKRIQKGKTANNLSADYFSLRNQWDLIGRDSFIENKYDFSLLWGTQRRVFKNMFINYELGYDFQSGNQWSGEIISELKIGLAF